MMPLLRNLALSVCTLAVVLPLAGCETNVATGRQIFTMGSTIQDDQRIGAQEHPKIVREFGGVYDDAELTSYVAIIASRLAGASEYPNIEWRFSVLNTDQLNAFALPGGYVYVTRGLLALADNEAELAGVLAHEIGHVTARHTAERQGRATAVGIFGALLGVAGGGALADTATQLGYANFVQHYSQSQEFEADTLGVRYLARTGYNIGAMADFLAKMRDYSRLQNKLIGRPESSVDEGDFLASHPRTVDRVRQATDEATRTSGSGTVLNRDTYLQRIDGMTFGDDADQGFIRGRLFVHPKLGFRFEVPEGFRLVNKPEAVLAVNPNGAAIVFDMETKRFAGNAAEYLRGAWASKANLQGLERIQVNGLDGATAVTRGRTNSGVVDVRFIALKQSDERIYRFLMVTPQNLTAQLSDPLRRVTYSLRSLSSQEAAQFKPWRVVVHRVAAGESVASLARRMPMTEFKEDWFRTLNGLDANEQVRAGQSVKLVAETR